MRNSLIYKLMGAFLLVVLVGAAVISFLLVRSTRSAFTRYSNRNGQALVTRLADRLGNYYSQNGSWAGVENYMNLEQRIEPAATQGGMMRMGRVMPGSGIIAALDDLRPKDVIGRQNEENRVIGLDAVHAEVVPGKGDVVPQR